MTGPEHYTAAEQHAATAGEVLSSDPAAAEFFVRLAGVHATLAVAAATALIDIEEGMPTQDARAWKAAAATPGRLRQ